MDTLEFKKTGEFNKDLVGIEPVVHINQYTNAQFKEKPGDFISNTFSHVKKEADMNQVND